jgi:hypothetical protein
MLQAAAPPYSRQHPPPERRNTRQSAQKLPRHRERAPPQTPLGIRGLTSDAFATAEISSQMVQAALGTRPTRATIAGIVQQRLTGNEDQLWEMVGARVKMTGMATGSRCSLHLRLRSGWRDAPPSDIGEAGCSGMAPPRRGCMPPHRDGDPRPPVSTPSGSRARSSGSRAKRCRTGPAAVTVSRPMRRTERRRASETPNARAAYGSIQEFQRSRRVVGRARLATGTRRAVAVCTHTMRSKLQLSWGVDTRHSWPSFGHSIIMRPLTSGRRGRSPVAGRSRHRL